MSNVPAVSGKDAVKALKKLGFQEARQKGSHSIMTKEGHAKLVTVPVHGNASLKTGTLKAIIRASGHSLKEFLAAM